LRRLYNGGGHGRQIVRVDHLPEHRRIQLDLLRRQLPELYAARTHVGDLVPAIVILDILEQRARHIFSHVLKVLQALL
jgi:hypothetical protein